MLSANSTDSKLSSQLPGDNHADCSAARTRPANRFLP
jgi:hypothetical protein